MFVGAVTAALILALTVSCADSSSDAGTAQPHFGGVQGYPLLYAGATSLEERIAWSDVIARVRLLSVSSAADPQDFDGDGTLEYYGALEHRFQALEYLKGKGGGELVGVVYDPLAYSTSQDAIANADVLLAGRDAQWDGREAIVFLRDDSPQSDRYWLGNAFASEPNPLHKDAYTIASIHTKNWLPEASTNNNRRSGVGDQVYLLDVPGSGEGAGLSRSVRSGATTPTITKDDLKARIATIEAEVAGGDGSQAYRDCVFRKYRWEREVRYSKEGMDGSYFYKRYDETIASGLPAETIAYTSILADHAVQTYGQALPATNWGEYLLVGTDEDVFHPRWPGVAVTARPLPTGEYNFYYAYRPPDLVICQAYPEDELRRIEVFVTVTAPSDTLHEAFFDPAAIGTAVGADATNGALTPTAFTVGGTATTLQSLKWESSVVTMQLSAAASLSGRDIDVIELDGSVSLTLSVADATSNAGGTLTWTEANQPWHDGDQLMLRIREAGPLPPPVPANLAAPTATRTSANLSWDAVANTNKYRVEYRALFGAWTTDDETLTGTAHTVDELTCGTSYEFRVSAYGDGSAHRAAWSGPATVWKTTTACNIAPVAGEAVRALSWLGPDEVEVGLDVIGRKLSSEDLEELAALRAILPTWIAEPASALVAES